MVNTRERLAAEGAQLQIFIQRRSATNNIYVQSQTTHSAIQSATLQNQVFANEFDITK